MKISASEITEQFDLLVSARRSREQIEAWAEERQCAEDEQRLEYDPPTDEARIWEAITYLCGVGLEVAPGEYLHSVRDFEEYRRTAGW